MYKARKLSIVGMILVLAAGSPLLGQTQRSESRPSPVEALRANTDLRVFVVERAEPQNILKVLQGLHLGVRFALDESSRTIIASGAEETLANVENLIRELDTPPSAAPARITLHLPIKYRNVEEVAELIDAASSDVFIRVVPDPGSNLIVVQGHTEALDEARKLVSRIDKPQASFSVSFFFIGASTTSQGKASGTIDLPAALMPVGETLARNGLGNMVLLAPLTARTQEGSEFSVGGYLAKSAVPGKGLTFTAEGNVREIAESNTVRSRIRATVDRENPEFGGRTIFSIDTTLVSPLGDYVVLATAPSSYAEYDVLALVVRVDGLK